VTFESRSCPLRPTFPAFCKERLAVGIVSAELSTRPACPQGQAILSNIVMIASFTRHKVGPTLLKKRDGRHQWARAPTPAKREPQNAPRRRNVRRYAVINPLK